VAVKVKVGTIASWPGPTPAARSARWRAAVPELTASACRTPISRPKSSSRRNARSPVVSHPERRVATTSATSSSPIEGR
jgi:hypothetical protein